MSKHDAPSSQEDDLNFCVQYNIKRMQNIRTTPEENNRYQVILNRKIITPSMIEQAIKKRRNQMKEDLNIDLEPIYRKNKELNKLLDEYIKRFNFNENFKQTENNIVTNFKLTKPQICQAVCHRIGQTKGIGSSYLKNKICEMYKQNINIIEENSKIISQKIFDLSPEESKVKQLKIKCKNLYKRKNWPAFEQTWKQLEQQDPTISRQEMIKSWEAETLKEC